MLARLVQVNGGATYGIDRDLLVGLDWKLFPHVGLLSRLPNGICERRTCRVSNVPTTQVLRPFVRRHGYDTIGTVKKMTERLQAMRRELGADLASDVALLARSLDDKGEDVTVSQHPADVASDLYLREELVAEERVLEAALADVEDALARIAGGTYGVCVACRRAIPVARLEARPQASRCIDCERLAEVARRR